MLICISIIKLFCRNCQSYYLSC